LKHSVDTVKTTQLFIWWSQFIIRY